MFKRLLIISTLVLMFIAVAPAFAAKPDSLGGGKGKDTEPPIVSIISPTSGEIVSETITVSIQASDNVGVTKIEFYVDDNLEHSLKEEPYEFTWATTTIPNGEYSILVKAYDKARNQGVSKPITITVQNKIGSNLSLKIQAELDYIVNSSWTKENKNSNGWQFFQTTDEIHGAINSNRIPFQGAPNRWGWVRPGISATAAIGMMQGTYYLYENDLDISKYDSVLEKFFLTWELSQNQVQNNNSSSDDYGAFMDAIEYDRTGNYDTPNPHWKTDVTAQMMISNWKYYEYNIKTDQTQSATDWIDNAWEIQRKGADYLVRMHDYTPAGNVHLLPGNSNEYTAWIHFSSYAVPALRSASVWAQKVGAPHEDYDRVANDLVLGIQSMKDTHGFFKYLPYETNGYGAATYGDSIDQLTFVPYESGALDIDEFAGTISDWWTNGDNEIKMTYQTNDPTDWRYYGTRWHYYFNGSSENDYLFPGPGFQLAKVEWKYGHNTNNDTYLNRTHNRLTWGESLDYSSLWWFLTGEEEVKVPNGFLDWRDSNRYTTTAENWSRFVDTSAYYVETLLMSVEGIDTDYNPILP